MLVHLQEFLIYIAFKLPKLLVAFGYILYNVSLVDRFRT